MKMKFKKISPTANPVLLANDFARSMAMMMPITITTIQPTNGTKPIRNRSSHHPGRPMTFSRT